jgi:hypothetical protein
MMLPCRIRTTLLAALLALVAASAPAQNTIRLEFADSSARATVVGSFTRGKTVYVSLSDLLHIFNVSSYENKEAKKVEIKRGTSRVKVSGANPFVVVSEGTGSPSTVQLADDILYAAGSFFVPLRSFLPLFPVSFGMKAF